MSVLPQEKIKKIVFSFFIIMPVLAGTLITIATRGNWKFALIATAFFSPFSLFAYFIQKRRRQVNESISKGNPAVLIISEIRHINKIGENNYCALLSGKISNNGSEYPVQKEFYFVESDIRLLQPGSKLPVMINRSNKNDFDVMMDEWKQMLANSNQI